MVSDYTPKTEITVNDAEYQALADSRKVSDVARRIYDEILLDIHPNNEQQRIAKESVRFAIDAYELATEGFFLETDMPQRQVARTYMKNAQETLFQTLDELIGMEPSLKPALNNIKAALTKVQTEIPSLHR